MLIEHKQTVETLIRRRIVRRLVWVSTVCICPAKRTLGLNWLMFECSTASIFCEGELQKCADSPEPLLYHCDMYA